MPRRRSKNADYTEQTDLRRGPSRARRPMPLKRCEWCRKIIERRPGEKSVLFLVRRFCCIKCMASAREFEKKIIIKTNRELRGKNENG